MQQRDWRWDLGELEDLIERAEGKAGAARVVGQLMILLADLEDDEQQVSEDFAGRMTPDMRKLTVKSLLVILIQTQKEELDG